MHDLGIKQLICLRTRFSQNRTSIFCVGEHGAVCAFIDKALAHAVDHDTIQIAQSIATVRQFARCEITPVCRNRRGVTSTPLPPRHRAKVHRHTQTITLVVRRAADFRCTDERTDMLGAHLYVCFKPATSEYHSLGVQLSYAIVITHRHAAHGSGFVL